MSAGSSILAAAAMAQQMDTYHNMLRQMLSTGALPVSEEIKLRDMFSQMFFNRFESTHNVEDLYMAIEHVETILRRLPDESPQLPNFLDFLSYMRVSGYGLAHAHRALDQAVDLGQRAKAAADRMDLPSSEPESYFKILNNLGYALSHRYAESGKPQDLDDSIAAGQELVRLSPKENPYHKMGITNLTSRLGIRYRAGKGAADREDLMRLINEQLSSSAPGTLERSAVLLQLGELAYEKFQGEQKLEDLEEAIRHDLQALEGISVGHELYVDTLRRLSDLHCEKHKKTGEVGDIQKAASYSKTRVECTHPSHPISGTYLWQYLLQARVFVNATSQVSDVQDCVDASRQLMSRMLGSYPRYDVCQWLLADLLARLYDLTGSLEHVLQVVEQTRQICLHHNKQAVKLGEAEVRVEKVDLLLGCLRKISEAPDDHTVTRVVADQLRGYFRSACEANGVTNASITMWNHHSGRLNIYADIAESGEDVSESELEQRVREDEEASKIARRSKRRTNNPPWRLEEYKTEFGLRKLAIDPVNRMIIFDIPGKVQEVFGYESMESLPIDQFIRQELRLEKESRERETQQGKHPNPNLCRVCRRLKVLRPSEDGDGFVWNQSVRFTPFGNYNQLFMRSSCAVCSLVLNLISMENNGRLHKRLALIDPDVQGTAIEPVKLSNGDEVLQVKYGLREVGALRIAGAKALLQTRGVDPSEERTAQTGVPVPGVGNTVPTMQLKRWINNCDHNHGQQCNYRPRLGRLSSHIPMVHIDVVDECLVKTTSAVKYFALSYVWGQAEMSKTLRSNFEDRCKKGGLRVQPGMTPFPKTIVDAMSLVRSLGERYLWIDALCIVQDDAENKQRDIERMDIVYSRAFATIVAMDGVDADSGLPGVQPGTRSPGSSKIAISNRSPDLAYDPESDRNEEIHIVATPQSFGLALDVSKWDSRGWTFQERLLSRRSLYLSKDNVYFQCPKEILDEAGSVEVSAETTTALLQNPLPALNQLEDMQGDEAVRAILGVYKSLVEKYTTRELSFQVDIINAFAGVFAVLEEQLNGRTICGLPSSLLDLALLWTPARELKRREDEVTGADVTALTRPGRNVQCPSWSWSGFVGPVEYRLHPSEEQRALSVPAVDEWFVYHQGRLYTTQGRAGIPSRPTTDRRTRSGPTPPVDTLVEFSKAEAETRRLKDLGPNVLQFEAFCVPASAFTGGTEAEYLSFQENIHTTGHQAIHRLYDQNGKHCGICFNSNIAAGAESPNSRGSLPAAFVAVSRYEETERKYRGLDRVEGEIPLFDTDAYPVVGQGSGLVDVLIVTGGRDGEEIAERLTVGRIHAQAWENASPVKSWIRLG